MNEAYRRQVKLLLDVLPEVAKEECFAMHGGTAINLFLQDMPRLSVDIDLTYVEIAERAETLDAINAVLLRTKERIEKLSASIRVQHNPNVCKLQISQQGVQIKIEVNMVGQWLTGVCSQNGTVLICARAIRRILCHADSPPWSALWR